uniref:KIB1-4 beta-propeller domain-containing protein n=1 Tax=Aegilops tauschii TaxID=37682 RepID=M8BSQ7_AEGTA
MAASTSRWSSLLPDLLGQLIARLPHIADRARFRATHTYRLHNHSSGVTVPLPELDSIIGNVPEDFEIRKVVMRSTPQDLIAVTANIWKYPLILCRPGKGVWVPRILAMPYFCICDILFSRDNKLYAITKAEDLFALHLAEDDDGKPTSGMLPAMRTIYGAREGWNEIHTSRHLVESKGKLLMVRRERLTAAITPTHHTRKVEVFEADMDTCAWVPTESGLGGDQAIFTSYRSSNTVYAGGEVEEDVIYFPDTNDVLDIRSKTIRPLMHMNPLHNRWRATWVFPPNLVV